MNQTSSLPAALALGPCPSKSTTNPASARPESDGYAGRFPLPIPIAMLGIPFDRVTTAETMHLFSQMIASGQPHYVATANVDFGVQALGDVELQRILAHADLVLCDGMPLVWASRLLGNPIPERVAGSDIVPKLLAEAERQGWRVFFLGGTSESVARAGENVRAKYPRLNLVGNYSPPFEHLIEMDHEDIARRIRETKPDILLVAFGCPKQEKWIGMHFRDAGVPISIGVGATIDFLAGSVKRAPVWMRHTGLEWVFRLCQEPRRLFGRYSKGLGVFGKSMLRQWWLLGGLRRHLRRTHGITTASLDDGSIEVVRFAERIDARTVHHHEQLWPRLAADEAHVILDVSRVRTIDSTGVGLLMRLQKEVSKSGRQLVLVEPTEPVKRGLALMAFTDFFPIRPDVLAACTLIRERINEVNVVIPEKSARVEETLVWQGDIAAANIAQVASVTRQRLESCEGRATDMKITLGGVRFIDSSGIGLMVRTRKDALSRGIQVRFVEPSPAVQNVLRILRMERLLQP